MVVAPTRSAMAHLLWGITLGARHHLRVSTDEQGSHGVSLKAQRAMVEAYAGLYGLELVAVVEDAGFRQSLPKASLVQQTMASLIASGRPRDQAHPS